MEYSELTDKIIGAAMKIHSTIGPGVLESVYRTCMAHELKKLGLGVSCEVVLPVVYDGLRLDSGFRIDLWDNHRSPANSDTKFSFIYSVSSFPPCFKVFGF